MNYNLVITLTHELSDAVEYKWTSNGICVNTKTGNIIQSIEKDRCKGYYIRGKFKSKTLLRKKLQKIKKQETPF